MADYYSIITNRGKELEAEALASGRLIVLTHFVVGDSNGKQVKPDPAQIRLINETYRGDIAELVVSPEQSTQLMAKIVLPTGIGGFTVREVGLMTDAGELYAVANCPSIDKPVGGVSVNMQFRLAVSDTSNITLNVATGDGLFLRIDQNLKEIKARGAEAQKTSRESIGVLDGTTQQKGLVQLNSAVNNTSETQASTPAAVKIAMDNANARLAKDRNGGDIPNVALFLQNLGLVDTINKAVGSLQKDQNGADVPQPDWFIRNIGAARAFNGGINIGGGGEWWTPDLISWLENQGAFNHPYWMCKGAWSYANNRVITDTGCGNIQLAGAVIEVMGHRGAMTIRVTTATAGAGTLSTQFTYTNHGDDYSPGWRRDFNTANKPTSEDVGALPITGGTVSGNLGATGIVQAGNSKKIALSSENTAAKNADFNLWGNAERPVVIEMRDESGWHFYSQRNKDGSITFAVNGQVTPFNYGNFDARYQLKDNYATQAWVLQNFVQNIRQSGVAYIDAEKNSGQRLVPAGGVLIGSQVNGEWDNNEGFYYTWIQQNINGNWLTIGRV
ncbi:phage tail protein [Citrobacter freundii]|uniref:phage tail protein n=2 Tax=Citrobacter freundii complex TaxID=1344959 RepID=UPI002158E120|nr:phage tail protein [Citrobacter freundii]